MSANRPASPPRQSADHRLWPWLLALVALCASLCLTACTDDTTAGLSGTGGVGEDGTGAPVKAASMGEVTGVDDTTLTVNGVTFDRQGAQVQDGQASPLEAQSLAPGMWVTVSGEAQTDGTHPVAQTIRVLPAARGVVSQLDPASGTLTLMETTVQVSPNTWVATDDDGSAPEAALLAGLQVGDLVEVHAALGASDGAMVASRVTKLAATPALWPYQLRGRVTELGANHHVRVGDQWVDTRQAAVALPRAWAVGMVVRVAAMTPPETGQAWPVARVTSDTDTLPANAAFVYLAGVVRHWVSGPQFDVESVPVDAT
ncbi:MAG: hypothetical protein RI907_221, partial [Pseudomonadota bacterium]